MGIPMKAPESGEVNVQEHEEMRAGLGGAEQNQLPIVSSRHVTWRARIPKSTLLSFPAVSFPSPSCAFKFERLTILLEECANAQARWLRRPVNTVHDWDSIGHNCAM